MDRNPVGRTGLREEWVTGGRAARPRATTRAGLDSDIAAHGMWKVRLRRAVRGGKDERGLDLASVDPGVGGAYILAD